jgi:hypothetical protein
MKTLETPSTRSPGLGECPYSTFFRQNNICMRAAVDSQYWTRTVAAESLIAQLHSQGKLTNHYTDAKIEKFYTKSKF